MFVQWSLDRFGCGLDLIENFYCFADPDQIRQLFRLYGSLKKNLASGAFQPLNDQQDCKYYRHAATYISGFLSEKGDGTKKKQEGAANQGPHYPTVGVVQSECSNVLEVESFVLLLDYNAFHPQQVIGPLP